MVASLRGCSGRLVGAAWLVYAASVNEARVMAWAAVAL